MLLSRTVFPSAKPLLLRLSVTCLRALVVCAVAIATNPTHAASAIGVQASGSPIAITFSNTPLVRPEGAIEPAISIASNGTMAITGGQWLFDPTSFGTHLWTGPFGSTPQFQGLLDTNLQRPTKTIIGMDDADVDLGSTGMLHATTLVVQFNPTFNKLQLGISAETCPGGTFASFDIHNCKQQMIDSSSLDRPWITSDGPHVWIAYHNAADSYLVQVQRSDDDGYTWKTVGDPIVGQDGATADATFNSVAGPIVADPFSHNVYEVYAAGEASIQKATTITFNNIYVARSTDLGKRWTTSWVFHAPAFTRLENVFVALAVDPITGNLYAAWSDGHIVYLSSSSDQGTSWSPAVSVSSSPATTAIFPWVAAYNGVADVVYYGTSASSNDDPSAVWNVYMAQTTDGGSTFSQSLVSNTPNHIGVVCLNGISCAPGTWNLRDLFEIAINPVNGKAGIIYADDTLTTDSSGNPVPQLVLAQQH